MIFKESLPIYQQIADYICEQILAHRWFEGERIPSVRDLGSDLKVNPNTVLRSFEWLVSKDIISNKRGLGYFVTDNAEEQIIAYRRMRFLEEELPNVFNTMKLLHIDVEEFKALYHKNS
ncbi:MAG: GntR family transcriptional regulator [Bacteroidales bacterium]|jgi:DNA-binding transcriptional regulator YhcF (GntR family)|nr:GntR family transcriptional regulator [Bacteroidales bacterium]